MGYNVVPTVNTGDSWTATQHNTYVRDNLSALWQYSAAGDLAYASSADTLARLGIGTAGQVLTVNAGATAPSWQTPSSGIGLAQVFPVGSVYISTSSTNPATLFGLGTWTAVAGRMLIGAGTSDVAYSAGDSGGASSVTLTESQMPVHTHVQNSHNHIQDQHRHSYTTPTGDNLIGTGAHGTWDLATTTAYSGYTTPTNQAATATNQNAGSGAAHTNMPPYLVVYIWTRTA